MKFNEDSRVKIPAILHLTRLGYQYLSLKNAVWDTKTNIFTDLFKESIAILNPEIEEEARNRILEDLSLSLENEDLGKAFYERLMDPSGIKLIDFSNFEKNSFHVVTELPCKNGDEEFRPDITLLLNGMPLVFIEVKKPNNREGIVAERKRINTRFQNKKFRSFVNITQLMIFSNNMEYNDCSVQPIEGAFYASPSYESPVFNYFREEENLDLSKILADPDEALEDFILKDNNLSVIKHNPEFVTNKNPNTPTNRLSTSLLSKSRLAFILRYAIAYVKESGGLQKHIMRYPQMFATKAISKTLDKGGKKGIIWHTQGSGKTALAFYNVRYLTDIFQKKFIIPKFYFIVDRIDLLIQAQREFSSRGLQVHTVSSREEFARTIKEETASSNLSGNPEITVVNIQKFEDNPDVVRVTDYNVRIQRIYFLDEVHRSYNPKGSFLANLSESDKNAIKIGLTGTPLLGDDTGSKHLFGDYIHKYYYNASIADGYTLRLIREEIETKYKMELKEALKEIEVLKNGIQKKHLYAHPKFVEPMLDYIVQDFETSRITLNDSSIGGMVICDSSNQAKEMHRIFKEKILPPKTDGEKALPYKERIQEERRVKTAALILHDVGNKEERKQQVEDFKAGKIDFLFVYNMLLTGFDSKRLKKLYLGRIIRKHNLLQALTRVNRVYKDFQYGYVVDFADISKEFEETNKAYFKELQLELGDEMEHYSNLFKSKEEVEEEITQIKEALLHFDTENAENFTLQINEIQDKKQLQTIKKSLDDAKNLYNLIRYSGHYDLLEKLDFQKLTVLQREVSRRLDLVNLNQNLIDGSTVSNILNEALEDVLFMFTKLSEEELVLADQLKDTLRTTREALAQNFDPKDTEFIQLKAELERLFKKKNLSEVSQEEINQNIGSLKKIHKKIKELNRKNNLLQAKYQNDTKYARVHKRIVERGDFSQQEVKIFEALNGVKESADEQVLQNTKICDNEGYFDKLMMPLVVKQFKHQQKLALNPPTSKFINHLVVNEYMNEFNGKAL